MIKVGWLIVNISATNYFFSKKMRFNYTDSFEIRVEDSSQGYGLMGSDAIITVEWFETAHTYQKRITIRLRWWGGQQSYGWRWNKKNDEDCDFHIYRMLTNRFDHKNTIEILKHAKIFNYRRFQKHPSVSF